MPDFRTYTEKTLLTSISEGNAAAFFEFYKLYAPRLRSYVLKSTRSETDTEEILQASFIRIWLSRDKLPEVENLSAWVYTLTARICLQHFRKQRRDKQRMTALAQVTSSEMVRATPAGIIQYEEIIALVQKVVQQMPAQRQQIYQLNRETGKKPSEIAIILNMPVGTVKNQLSAAMKEIRAFLIKSGYDEFPLLFIFLGLSINNQIFL